MTSAPGDVGLTTGLGEEVKEIVERERGGRGAHAGKICNSRLAACILDCKVQDKRGLRI